MAKNAPISSVPTQAAPAAPAPIATMNIFAAEGTYGDRGHPVVGVASVPTEVPPHDAVMLDPRTGQILFLQWKKRDVQTTYRVV